MLPRKKDKTLLTLRPSVEHFVGLDGLVDDLLQ